MRRKLIRGVAWLLASFAAICALMWLSLPSTRDLTVETPRQTAYSRARASSQPATPQRFGEVVTLENLSPWLMCAVVKAEDRAFVVHGGVDMVQSRRALRGWLRRDERALGGSTITQQLARNLYLSSDRNLWRKLREMLIAGKLERSLDKRRILELYLNVVEWGDGIWGIDAASRHYFDKPPSQLGLLESIVLAAMLPSPRSAMAGTNLERVERTHRRILGQFRVSKLITEDDHALQFRAISELDHMIRDGIGFTDALARLKSHGESTAPASPPRDISCGYEIERDAEQKAMLARRAKENAASPPQ